MFNFLKKFLSCKSCDSSSPKKNENEENKDKYKCNGCGSVSENEAGECCGSTREKVCSCGSGKPAKECCES